MVLKARLIKHTWSIWDIIWPKSGIFHQPRFPWNNRKFPSLNHHLGWRNSCEVAIPIGSMYGIFTCIYHKNQPDVGKYTIHGSYGIFGSPPGSPPNPNDELYDSAAPPRPPCSCYRWRHCLGIPTRWMAQEVRKRIRISGLLVGGWTNPSENILIKIGSFPQIGVIKKMKPPPPPRLWP